MLLPLLSAGRPVDRGCPGVLSAATGLTTLLLLLEMSLSMGGLRLWNGVRDFLQSSLGDSGELAFCFCFCCLA